MRRAWLLAILLAVGNSAGAKNPSPLQSRLNNEFLNKAFTTKIQLGSYVRDDSQSVDGLRLRLIDTEVSPNGGIQYLVRKGQTIPPAPSFYIAPDAMTGSFSPGTTIYVTKVELKEDRIEFWLSTAPGSRTVESYAKLKFMLGRDYPNSDYDSIMNVIAGSLRVERYERLLTLESEFETLKGQLSSTEERYRQGATTTARLENAAEVRELLEKIATNRSEVASMGKPTPDADNYRARARALDDEIERLQQQERKEKLEEAHRRLGRLAVEAQRLKSVLQQKPLLTLAAWQEQSNALQQYRKLLQERQTLYGVLQSNGDAVPPADLNRVAQELREADTLGEALQREHGRLELVSLDDEYRGMERRRAQLVDAYTRAFGTAQERSALQALISHLQTMRNNRFTAQQRGSQTAAVQVAQLLKEIEKFQKR